MATLGSIFQNIFTNSYSTPGQLQTDLRSVTPKLSDSDITTAVSNFSKNVGRGAVTGGSTASASGAISSLGSGIQSVVKNAGEVAFSMVYDQKNYDRAILNVGDLQTAFNTVVATGLSATGQIGNAISGLLSMTTKILDDAFEREGKVLESLTTKAGLVGDIALTLEKTINDGVVPGAQLLGINFETVKSATETLVKNSERFSLYQSQTLLDALKMGAAYGETAAALLESVESFRNVGISLADATVDIEDIGTKSISQGLSARATTKTVIENLDKLNSFGFKNGVEGLGNMVRQAQALKFNMSEVFTVAEKLYDPEAAINLAANLQVVGGAFGDLGDPIKLMYDATNNVESLQTSILGAARSLATYNDEQGRFEVTGINLRRAKAMADAMGISMKELTSAAVKGQVQMQALSEVELFDLTDDQKQFVSNLATMKGGVIGFDVSKEMGAKLGIKEGFLSLQNLSADQLLKVVKVQEDIAKKTPEQLIRDQYTVATQSLNALNSIAMNIGNVVKGRIQSSDEYKTIVEKLGGLDNIAKMSPEEINEKYNEIIGQYINPTLTQIKEMASKFGDVVTETGGGLLKGAADATGIDLDKLPEQLMRKAEEVKEAGKEVLRELGITVKVDLNSTSPELAEMFVAEIDRNPKLKSDLAGKIFGNKREYT
jgi:hypothetical protein